MTITRLGGLLVTAAALAACERRAPPPPAPRPVPAATRPAASAPAPQALLSAAKGEVEVKRGATWQRLAAGTRLDRDDVIRTAVGAAATVSIQDIEVQLQASTEVSLRELTATASRVRLERGRLGASVASDRVVLKVESSGSSAVAEARRGRFAVFTDGKGLVAVTATAGEVKLASSGGDALLGAGERAVVVADQAPRREAVPASVFLKVKWPEAATNAKAVVMRGRADVGAAVAINGQPAEVGADGTFTATVVVARGQNDVEVVATDLGGRSASARGVVQVQRTAPRIEVEKPVWK